MSLSAEIAVYIYSENSAAVNDCSCQPRLAAPFDHLLQALLKLIDFQVRQLFLGKKTETTDSCFNLAHAPEVRQFIQAPRQVFSQTYLALNGLCISLPAHELNGHPKLE